MCTGSRQGLIHHFFTNEAAEPYNEQKTYEAAEPYNKQKKNKEIVDLNFYIDIEMFPCGLQ